MGNRVFSHTQVVKYVLLAPLIMMSPMAVLAMGVTNFSWFAIIPFLILYVQFVGIALIFNNRAFVRVTIDENGIRNRYIGFTWEEIDQRKYEVFRINIRYQLLVKFKPAIGIGEFSKCDFHFQNHKKAVFFSFSKKTVKLLKQYSDKSKLIQEVLARFVFEDD